MHIFVIIDSITMAGVLLLGITSLLKGGYKNPINRYYAGFSITLVIWISMFDFACAGYMPKNIGLIGNYLGYAFAIAVETFFMLFVAKLTGNAKFFRFVKWFQIFSVVMFFYTASPLFVQDVVKSSSIFDYYSIIYGPIPWLYGVAVTVLYGIIVIGGIHFLKKQSEMQYDMSGRESLVLMLVGG